jgi:hypothetical protein
MLEPSSALSSVLIDASSRWDREVLDLQGAPVPPPPAGPGPAAPASIRTQVTVPLRLSDGYATTAGVFTFDRRP